MSSQPQADLWCCVTVGVVAYVLTTHEQISSCQLTQKTHSQKETHIHVHWSIFNMHPAITTHNVFSMNQCAQLRQIAKRHNARTIRIKRRRGFDCKRHKRIVPPAEPWQKSSVILIRYRAGKNYRPIDVSKVNTKRFHFFILIILSDENSIRFLHLAQASVIFGTHRCL